MCLITFRVLLIEDAVGMDCEWPSGKIPQVYCDCVTHFSLDDGTKESQPGRLGYFRRVGGIGILLIDGLLVNAAHSVLGMLEEFRGYSGGGGEKDKKGKKTSRNTKIHTYIPNSMFNLHSLC